MALWCRPTSSNETASIDALQAEMEDHTSSICVLVGDMNVHKRRWLLHSARDSVEGWELKSMCRELGLKQMVSSPTRYNHLLDLVLTDLPGPD